MRLVWTTVWTGYEADENWVIDLDYVGCSSFASGSLGHQWASISRLKSVNPVCFADECPTKVKTTLVK